MSAPAPQHVGCAGVEIVVDIGDKSTVIDIEPVHTPNRDIDKSNHKNVWYSMFFVQHEDVIICVNFNEPHRRSPHHSPMYGEDYKRRSCSQPAFYIRGREGSRDKIVYTHTLIPQESRVWRTRPHISKSSLDGVEEKVSQPLTRHRCEYVLCDNPIMSNTRPRSAYPRDLGPSGGARTSARTSRGRRPDRRDQICRRV
ncbi:hypothetical protein EVAR_77144_1 [Eumeta japonica]|uniref:Uncharacterized protein n=1 Tax=Eumeta variegata TaxID=151549 RepID=A0A4C1T2P2_EUMVA|nr:hypothetical protein EVAR_77144_1 [Eumeta japonica]